MRMVVCVTTWGFAALAVRRAGLSVIGTFVPTGQFFLASVSVLPKRTAASAVLTDIVAVTAAATASAAHAAAASTTATVVTGSANAESMTANAEVQQIVAQ